MPRFLQISTDEVYGSAPDGVSFAEEAALRPSSPCAASKAAADLLVQSYVRTYSFPALILRCSNNYGPYQFPEKLIPLMIANALEDRPLPVYSDGLNVRDWIHVEDHCRAIYQALEKGRPGEVYNIGGVALRTNLEVIGTLLRLLGKPESLINFVEDRSAGTASLPIVGLDVDNFPESNLLSGSATLNLRQIVTSVLPVALKPKG